MRAVFTIDLPEKNGKFPSIDQIVGLVRTFGWEFQNMGRLTSDDIRAIMRAQRAGAQTEQCLRPALQSEVVPPNDPDSYAQIDSPREGLPPAQPSPAELHESSIREHYKRLAVELFREMPEVAAAEKNAVVFLGYIADDQTLFVMTRMVPGQITFRLLHRELTRLQTSTDKMMRKIVAARLDGQPLHVCNPTVNVYERLFDHVIITGRVITDARREAVRSNLKDTLLFAIPLGFLVPILYVLLRDSSAAPGSHDLWHGTLERMSTALLTTALVSALGLLQTWIEIRRAKIIDWSVPKDKR